MVGGDGGWGWWWVVVGMVGGDGGGRWWCVVVVCGHERPLETTEDHRVQFPCRDVGPVLGIQSYKNAARTSSTEGEIQI